jgi:hypothetical protein
VGNNYIINPDADYGLGIVSSSVIIQNNIIAEHQHGDLHTWGTSDHYTDIDFYFNTVAFNGTGTLDNGIIIGDYVVGDFRNSIVSNHHYGFYNAGHVNGEIQISYLLMDGNTYNYDGFTYSNGFTGDPLFVNPDNSDYHIQRGSAAINKSPGSIAVIDDIDRQYRPNSSDTGWPFPADLGADEYCLPRYFPIIRR